MNKKNFALNKHTWFVGLVFGLLLVLALITNIQSVNADNGYVVDPANYLNKNTEEYIERLNEQDLTGLTDRPQYMVAAVPASPVAGRTHKLFAKSVRSGLSRRHFHRSSLRDDPQLLAQQDYH